MTKGVGIRALVVLVCGGVATPAAAQSWTAALRTRVSLAGALMVSRDQAGRLGYDNFGLLACAQVGYAVVPWLDLDLGMTAGGFPAPDRTGALLSPLLGAELGTPVAETVRPYIQLAVGPSFTGSLIRPFARIGVGADVLLTSAFALGPVVGYAQLFQTNHPGDSTDARFFWFGVTVSFRPGVVSADRTIPVLRERWIVHRVGPPAPPAPLAPPDAPATTPPSPQLLELIDRTVPRAHAELLAPVLFRFDSDELEAIGVAMLHEVARELARRPDLELLEIRGYADKRGSDAYNDSLSTRRAERVREWLVAHGVDAARLEVAGKGAAEPVERGEREEELEQNRRVVFRVLRMKSETP